METTDIFENPKIVLREDFDPRSISVLGVRMGDETDVLSGWEVDWNDTNWWHVNGGVGFGVKDNVICKIKLPVSFVERLEIESPDHLFRLLGKNDDMRETKYRDRLHHCGYIWNRGLIFWWELLPALKPSHLTIFDPQYGVEQFGKKVTYRLLLARDCVERKPAFELLPSGERENLEVGDGAKLAFDIVIDEKHFIERMWVRVTEVLPELYRGKLMNDPYCTFKLKSGTEVQFHSDHVIAIQRESGSP